MNPYQFVTDATSDGGSLLALCAGIGFELSHSVSGHIVAVDIVPEYVKTLKERHPHVHAVCADALQFVQTLPDECFDIVSLIDAIEHFEKRDGRKLLEHSIRVSRRRVLVFTPEGWVRNEPHAAWGINAGDEYQIHLSGWTHEEDLAPLGFELTARWADISQHGDPYHALVSTLRK